MIFGKFYDLLFFNLELIIEPIGTSLGSQPWSSKDSTYSGSSSHGKLPSDELVGDNLLLKDLLVCHIEAACCGVILTREYLMNFIYSLLRFIWNKELLNIMRYSKRLNKFRCVMIRVDSFVVVNHRNDSYARVCRSSLNVNQSLQLKQLFCRSWIERHSLRRHERYVRSIRSRILPLIRKHQILNNCHITWQKGQLINKHSLQVQANRLVVFVGHAMLSREILSRFTNKV